MTQDILFKKSPKLSTPGTGTPWALWRRGRCRNGGILCRRFCLVRPRLGRCRYGRRGWRCHGRDSLCHDTFRRRRAGGRRCHDTHPPRLTLLEPLHGGKPERLGPTKGRTITLLAQLRGKRVNSLKLFRAHPYLYWQFHYTAESSWWWGHTSCLLSVISCLPYYEHGSTACTCMQRHAKSPATRLIRKNTLWCSVGRRRGYEARREAQIANS